MATGMVGHVALHIGEPATPVRGYVGEVALRVAERTIYGRCGALKLRVAATNFATGNVGYVALRVAVNAKRGYVGSVALKVKSSQTNGGIAVFTYWDGATFRPMQVYVVGVNGALIRIDGG